MSNKTTGNRAMRANVCIASFSTPIPGSKPSPWALVQIKAHGDGFEPVAFASLLRRQLVAFLVRLDSIQALAGGNVERLCLLATAEADVGRNFRLDIADLFPLRR